MNYPSITLTGPIFTFDTLEKVAIFDECNQTAQEYGASSKDELRDNILFEWAQFRERYKRFNDKIEKTIEDKKTTVTRNDLVKPLLLSLGYEVKYDASNEIIDDRSYNINHRATNLDNFPLYIIGAHQSLDRKEEGKRNSPHAQVQEYLNHTEHLYGLVSNGKQLRLLRDSSILTKLSYLEFNLERMVEEELYADFVLMYLLLHSSRMPQSMGAQTSIIEQYHDHGLESGSRIRERLSIAVERAILNLGDGLLREDANQELRDWVRREGAKSYYAKLLKLVYRMLFLMVIEERDLIFPEVKKEDKDEAEKILRNKRIYASSYSMERFRKLCKTKHLIMYKHTDLWENLKNTFQLFEPIKIGIKLGIQPLGGDLFSTSAIAMLYNTKMRNGLLMDIINSLHQFESKQGVTIAINYKSLDVEEFGSVYEGLLEKEPLVSTGETGFSFVQGKDRSSSGSHYTPDELVQPLIKHSLEHLIQDIVSDKLVSNTDKVEKLLKLKVADIACGSGHILLAAARRIGLEIARLRTGSEQPEPNEVRRGVRHAIRNCIYGVDYNPYAVELCKVALWLEAHVPGEPLNFLDSKIKCGNAIVGLAHFDELENGIADEAFKKLYDDEDADILKEMRRDNKKGQESWKIIKSADNKNNKLLENYKVKAVELNAILDLPENNIEDIETKQKAYIKYLSGPEYLRLRSFADIQIAQFFTKKTIENKHKLLHTIQYGLMYSGQTSMQTQSVAYATGLSYEKKFFHWFLEFPEVFAQGGFDCILGNPPFLGGQKLSGTFGKDFAEYIKHYFAPIGSVDLVTYFFRRIYSIIKQGGYQSLISTNTIAQGDARTGGLEVITEQQGGSINHAIRSMKWPGLAAVEVALVTLYKGQWQKSYVLDGRVTTKINTYLDDQVYLGNPYKLAQNANKSFQGSIVLGHGFVLEPEEAKRLIDLDPRNAEVIFPYLNGQDLNNEVDQAPTRWVINFFDWPEERAMTYPEPYRILLEKVKPDRATIADRKEILNERDKKVIQNWWQYESRRPNLYNTIREMDRVLVVAQVSKTLAFTYTTKEQVISMMCIVLAFENSKYYAIVQNSLHYWWVTQYASKLKTDLRYTPSDVFETFPFPQLISIELEQRLEQIGETYHEYRRQLMLDVQLGLTKLYNCFHDREQRAEGIEQRADRGQRAEGIEHRVPVVDGFLAKHLKKTPHTIPLQEAIEKIVHLRALHKEMDLAVLEVYGWHIDSLRWGKAIDLRHDFYEVDYLPENDRVRYTIHPDARKEVLKRLLLLNHEVHDAETRNISYATLNAEKVLTLMKDHFRKEWNIDASYMQPGTLHFLTTAEELWPSISKSTAQIYNPIVQAYGSAIESELQEKLFIPFTHHMHTKFQGRDLSDLTFREKDIKYVNIFANKLHRSQTDYTLGNIHLLLSVIDNTKHPSVMQSIILQEFRDFYFSIYKRALLQDPFSTNLKRFIDKYRNEAAHTGQVSKEEAMKCKELVKELVGVMVGSEY